MENTQNPLAVDPQSFLPPIVAKSEAEIRSDKTLKILIVMTQQTNLVALDKTLAAIRRSSVSYAAAALRVSGIAQRITHAIHEVGSCLLPEQRASK